MGKSALGKGLGALINSRVTSPAPLAEHGERIQEIPLGQIVPSPLQPRTTIREDELGELIESVRTHGIIQPLIVRQREGHFELIAGERRWRAAKEVGLESAPVIVREASDQEVLELALIENIQRADLNPIEEAQAFARLAREFGLKQEEIAQKVGKSRAGVANSMRLLDLDPQVQAWLAHEKISVGHAKVLLSLKSHEEQRVLAEAVLRQNHTVRRLEKLVAEHLRPPTRTRHGGGSVPAASSAIDSVRSRLQDHLATRVAIHHGRKKGRIEIEYYGDTDLNRILDALGLPPE